MSLRIPALVFFFVMAGTGRAEDAAFSVAVDEPVEEAVFVSPPAWTELKGRAGTASGHDVVVIVDLSGSTADASGVDVDEDGTVGKGSRRRGPRATRRFVSSDPDDSVLAAELRAIRTLSEQVDRARNRLGIVSFSGRPRIETALGTTHDHLELALQNLQGAFAGGGTDLSKALDHATHMLAQAPEAGSRQRSILILSDGEPSVPPPMSVAASAAVQATERAAEQGIRVHAFALHLPQSAGGPDPGVYERIAEAGGGLLVRVEKPGEVIHELPDVRLGSAATVAITNVSTGEEARALRMFADGSFDAFVRLVEGPNRVRVTAVSESGERAEVTRTIRFEPRKPRDAQEAAAFEQRKQTVLERLRARAVETELARRASERAEPGPREFEVDVELDE